MRILGFILILFITACQNSDKVNPDMIHFPDPDAPESEDLPVISFQDTIFAFGTIIEGEIVEASFQFTNTGKTPLVLTRVEPSCGCTVAKDWPRDPIAPGEGGVISVNFDSNRRAGAQKKSLYIVANTHPATTMLYLEGVVAGPEK